MPSMANSALLSKRYKALGKHMLTSVDSCKLAVHSVHLHRIECGALRMTV